MTNLSQMYDHMIECMGVSGLTIPLTAVRLYRGNDEVPEAVLRYQPHGLTFTSCQAARQSSLGDPVCLTRDTIGCVAAAISFGLVDQNDQHPLSGPRVYTDIPEKAFHRWP